MLGDAANYVDKLVVGLIGLALGLVGWTIRVVFTNSKKIERTEAVLDGMAEAMREHKKDLHEIRSESTQAVNNQAKILELIERMKNN